GAVCRSVEGGTPRGLDRGEGDSGSCERTDPDRPAISHDPGNQEAAGVERYSVRWGTRSASQFDGRGGSGAAQGVAAGGLRSVRVPGRRTGVKSRRTAWIIVALLWPSGWVMRLSPGLGFASANL